MTKITELDLRTVTQRALARREITALVFVPPDVPARNDNKGPRETSYAGRVGPLGYFTRIPFFLKHNM